LLVGHGSTNPQASGSTLSRHADALRRSGWFADVGVASLLGHPHPAAALASLKGHRVDVVPLFMCDSHFADALASQTVTDERGRRRVVRLYPPLGLYPALTELIVQRAAERAVTLGLSPGEAVLLLVGHGSPKNPASRRATELHASRARARSPFWKVWTAYLDEAPHVNEVLAALSGPAIVCGLFVENGRHAGQDLPGLIRAHGTADTHYLGAIGADPAITTLILRLTGRERASPQASNPDTTLNRSRRSHFA